ncbi:hypothetical protein AAV32_16640 [Kerstersia gyiorum]|uniref:Uncharacterized protein n=1 Tax=Kerstersia gyiorum TaxID=206506 RepID=A0A171KN98_9BURK|nr:hypothetical protein AAV32_16640 [Kerstersia gyiorum]
MAARGGRWGGRGRDAPLPAWAAPGRGGTLARKGAREGVVRLADGPSGGFLGKKKISFEKFYTVMKSVLYFIFC